MDDQPETLWQPAAQSPELIKPKALRPLTRKHKAFTKEYGANPKISATEAVRRTYNVTSDHSAEQIAHELLRKPEIRTELAKYESKAENNLMILADKSTELAMTGTREGASYAAVSERVNNSIIDRLRGKSTIRTEIQSQAVTLNIDLTGAVEDTTA